MRRPETKQAVIAAVVAEISALERFGTEFPKATRAVAETAVDLIYGAEQNNIPLNSAFFHGARKSLHQSWNQHVTGRLLTEAEANRILKYAGQKFIRVWQDLAAA